MVLIRLADGGVILPVFDGGVGVPNIFAMAERGVENFSVAVRLAPRNGEMSGGTVFRMLVEDEQVVNLRRVVVLKLVNLLLRNRPGFAEMRRGRVLRVLVQTFHAHLRAVMRKFAAEHRHKIRPAVKRVARRMDANERMAGLDPVEKALLVGNRQITGGAGENHAVVILQPLRRKFCSAAFKDRKSVVEGK